MSGTQTVPTQNLPTTAFLEAFTSAITAETQSELKPFWSDAMRIGNRRHEIETLSAPRASFVPANASQELAAIWNDTKTLTRRWSNKPPPQANEIPAALAAMTGLLNRISLVSQDWFRNPYLSTLRDDGRVVLPSQLANHILQEVRRDTDRPAFMGIVTSQINNWTVPRLHVWFTAMGVPSVANGRIRLQELSPVQGKKVHLSNYLANVDATTSIRDPIQTVMDALFPPAQGDWLGTHVTMELFGQDHQDNPRYYKGRGWRSNQNADVQLANLQGGVDAARADLQQQLTDALNAYQQKVQTIINERRAAVI